MADPVLMLNGYQFVGFGVPERIPGGGKQQLAVHKLLGGARVIDALGPDDDTIQFKGRFRYARAMADAMVMEAIKNAGTPVVLTYWNLTYTVVVSKFTWSFEKFYEIPYDLECTVVSSSTHPAISNAQTQDGAVGSDLSLSQQMVGG